MTITDEGESARRRVDRETLIALSADVDISWQAPPGFQTAHAEFRTWLETTYPDRYDEMYEGESILYTEASGAARRELLDEFLAFRDG